MVAAVDRPAVRRWPPDGRLASRRASTAPTPTCSRARCGCSRRPHRTDDDAFARCAPIVSSLGADVVALAPERHDALVAVVSHVPHLTAATLMRLADERAEEHRALLRLAAGGFRDMTRIAAGHPGIWPDICAENRDGDRRRCSTGSSRGWATCATSVEQATARALLAVLERAAGRTAQPAEPGRAARGAGRGPRARPRPAGRAGRGHHARRRARRQHRRLRDRPLERGRPRAC